MTRLVQKSNRLVVVSNRLPATAYRQTDEERRAQPVGGLVSAVRSALEQNGGLWLGWSGTTVGRREQAAAHVTDMGSIKLATIDLTADEANLFYTVFSNRTLWPLLHSFPSMLTIRHDAYRAYRRVNQRFAESLLPLLNDGDVIWVQDYHLIPLGAELRRLGWSGKIGFFLHTPFPPPEIFTILPWARRLLEEILDYDLVGLHTERYAHNLLDALMTEIGGTVNGSVFSNGDEKIEVNVHPIGIDPEQFEEWAKEPDRDRANRFVQRLTRRGDPAPPRIVLGVDRLDYSKGIPQRLLTFEQLLEKHPSLRRKVSMVQVSAPSRSRVPEYIREREKVDQLVGRINGRFAEADWIPVYYLYRSYTQRELAGFYQAADVCLVTPLRDGMNLIAKEFIASQGDDPGVLVLSKFCGAAETMQDAVIVNPYDTEGTAEAIHAALQMPIDERRAHWNQLMSDIRAHTARGWGQVFLKQLSR